MSETALIVGAGDGLSASIARLFARNDMRIGLAARNPGKLAGLAEEIGASSYECDVSAARQVDDLFDSFAKDHGVPDVVVFNPSARVRALLVELDPNQVQQSIAVTAFGGFLVGQAAARTMLDAGRGTILFTGASASVKGYAQSATFAMGKFALRGLAQSMARELHPQGIHIGHVVIDGAIRSSRRSEPADAPDSMLDPDAIAETYLHLIRQPRNSWAWEIELRPWVERF